MPRDTYRQAMIDLAEAQAFISSALIAMERGVTMQSAAVTSLRLTGGAHAHDCACGCSALLDHVASEDAASQVESSDATPGEVKPHAAGDAAVHIGGDATVSPGDDAVVSSGGDATVSSGGDATVSSGRDATVSSGGDATVLLLSRPDVLTSREREVLALVAKGLPNRNIARYLGISEKTVKNHLAAVFVKLGVSDRTQAALHAVRTGLVGL
jgi:DNA-binding CsgD family transcriptional regulator